MSEIIIKDKVKTVIKNLLSDNVNLRDDDRLLYEEIIKVYIPEYKRCSADELLYHIRTTVPNYETVRRTRQLLQEQIPQLRGSSYDIRHKLSIDVKDEIIQQKNKKNKYDDKIK